MAQRGRNRNGFYIALLHVLELQYRREREVRSRDPAQWQPSPQSRPDQFLRWVLDVLAMLGFAPPASFAEVLHQVRALGLEHVALLLDDAVRRMTRTPTHGGLAEVHRQPPEALLERYGMPTRALEKHPQVRKFSKLVAERLDASWRRALVATAGEFLAIEGLHPSALALGGLPPSFPVLNDIILARLADDQLVADRDALTVLQFYGLVTGTLPDPPASWTPAVGELEKLSPSQLRLLASLTCDQARQLRTIRGDAWWLLKARRRLRMPEGSWIAFGQRLENGPDRARERALTTLRAALPAEFEHGASDGALQALAASPTWPTVAQIDEEVARLLTRGEVSRRLLRRFQSWDEATWNAARRLLDEDRDRCVAYVEDRQVLQRLFLTRTHARLNLRDLFPESMAWLDAFVCDNLEDALIHDVAEVETTATIVSRRIQEQFWSALSQPPEARSGAETAPA